MGSNSSQGWYLFTFLVGFTLGPAGMFALGWTVAVVGIALIVVAFVGLRTIKETANDGRASTEQKQTAPAGLKAGALESF